MSKTDKELGQEYLDTYLSDSPYDSGDYSPDEVREVVDEVIDHIAQVRLDEFVERLRSRAGYQITRKEYSIRKETE